MFTQEPYDAPHQLKTLTKARLTARIKTFSFCFSHAELIVIENRDYMVMSAEPVFRIKRLYVSVAYTREIRILETEIYISAEIFSGHFIQLSSRRMLCCKLFNKTKLETEIIMQAYGEVKLSEKGRFSDKANIGNSHRLNCHLIEGMI